MTNAPESRKTHVVRLLGTNKNDDILPDMQLDIERMDIAKSVYQTAETNWQGLQRLLKWLDDPDGDDYNPDGPASRKVEIVKVCLPDEENQSDPEEFWKVPVIKGIRLQEGDQGQQDRFINDELTRARIVENRRILHYDTNIDDKAQAAFDEDPTRKAFVVPGDQYTRDEETKDDSQFLEHEIITFLKGRVNNETGTGQGDDQGQQTKLLNQYLIDESEEAKLEVVGENGINPPWRLDPYQNIVNVQMGGCTQFDNFGDGITSYIGAPHCGESTSRITIVIAFRVLTPDEVKESTPFAGPPIPDQVNGNVCFVYDDSINSDNKLPAFFIDPAGIRFNMCGNSYVPVTGFSRDPNFDPFADPPQDPPKFDILQMPTGLFQVGASFNFSDIDTSDGHFHVAVLSIDASGPSSAILGELNANDPPTSISLGRFGSGVKVKATLDGVAGEKSDDRPVWEGESPPDQTWARLVAVDPSTPNDGSFGNLGDFLPIYARRFWDRPVSPVDPPVPDTFDEFFTYPPVDVDLADARAYVTGGNIAIASIQMWPAYIEDSFFVGKTDSGELIMVNPKTSAQVHGEPILWCQGSPSNFMKNKTGPVFTDKVGYVQPFSRKPRYSD